MNYGLYYKEVEFNRHSIDTVRKAISGDLDWKKGSLHSSQRSTRSSSSMDKGYESLVYADAYV